MTHVKRQALVPYTPAEMYDLVKDVSAYPDFLNWCAGSTVHDQSETSQRASVDLARAGIHKTFTTQNTMLPNERINMALVDGPFQHLVGHWLFTPLGDKACKITLDLEFEFSSRIMSATFGMIFKQIANTMVDAFSHRAVQIYGERQL